MALWILLDAEGKVRGQIATDGRTPMEDGMNPGALEEIEVERFGDLAYESWDAAGGWTQDWSIVDVRLHAKIDAEAGEFRKRFMTDVPGQELTYRRKEDDARAFMAKIGAGETPDIWAFQYIMAESDATGADPLQAAQTIVYAADQLTRVGAIVEGVRIGRKRAVTAAQTLEEKEAAATIDWDALQAAGLPQPPPPPSPMLPPPVDPGGILG